MCSYVCVIVLLTMTLRGLSGINQHQIRWLCHASKETYTQHHLNSLSNMAWQLWLKKGASPVHGDSLSPQGDPSGDLPWVQLFLTHDSSDYNPSEDLPWDALPSSS